MNKKNIKIELVKFSPSLVHEADTACKRLFLEWPAFHSPGFEEILEIFARVVGYPSHKVMIDEFKRRGSPSVATEASVVNSNLKERARIIKQRICFIVGTSYREAVILARHFDPFLPHVRVGSFNDVLLIKVSNGLKLAEVEKLYLTERNTSLASLVSLAFDDSMGSDIKRIKISRAINQLNDLAEYIEQHRSWAAENEIEIGEQSVNADEIDEEIFSLVDKLGNWKKHVGTSNDWFFFYNIAAFVLQKEIEVTCEDQSTLRQLVSKGVPFMIMLNS